jgi:hypothetical protein
LGPFWALFLALFGPFLPKCFGNVLAELKKYSLSALQGISKAIYSLGYLISNFQTIKSNKLANGYIFTFDE